MSETAEQQQQLEQEPQQLMRLPLWRSALDALKQVGVHYGQTIPAEWFEKFLRTGRDTMQFGIAVSEIRRELEKDGYYLSGRGQKGNQFVILPPSSNADVMDNYSRAAADALKRGVILGTNTRLDTLNESERRRHEGTLERMAIKSVLIQRTRSVQKVLQKHAPKVLGSDSSSE